MPDGGAADRYAEPSARHAPPGERPWMDLVAGCPPERLAELRRLEQESTWRCGPADRVGLARDGVTLLCGLMRQGPSRHALLGLDLFGDRAFRIALHHARPGAMSPIEWKYWHLRLHGERPRRPAPTMVTEMKAAGALPPDTEDPAPTVWPPLYPDRKSGYAECLPLSI